MVPVSNIVRAVEGPFPPLSPRTKETTNKVGILKKCAPFVLYPIYEKRSSRPGEPMMPERRGW